MSIHHVNLGGALFPINFPSEIPVERQLELLKALRGGDELETIEAMGGADLQKRMLAGLVDIVSAKELGKRSPIDKVVRSVAGHAWLTEAQHAA